MVTIKVFKRPEQWTPEGLSPSHVDPPLGPGCVFLSHGQKQKRPFCIQTEDGVQVSAPGPSGQHIACFGSWEIIRGVGFFSGLFFFFGHTTKPVGS